MKRVALLFAIVVGGTSTAQGDEPSQAFLDALRENGYLDVAIDYLTELEGGDLITPEFRRILPFEKAETLIAAASKIRDYDVREASLDEAQQLLADYANQNQSLEVTARTLRFQGNLLYQRASIYIKRSNSDRLTASEKDAFNEKSRTMLQEALKAFKQAKSQIARLVDPKSSDAILLDPSDPSTYATRKKFRKTYTDLTVQVPMVIEQLADTYAPGDAAREALLQDAVIEYKKIWDAYHENPRGFPAGVQACVFAARCSQKLGEHQAALNLLSELFDLGLLRGASPLSQKAYLLAAESWGHLKLYPHAEVILRLDPIVKTLSRVEIREPAWLRVQLELAVAMHAKAGKIKETPGARSNVEARAVDRAAAKVLRNVARVASPYRDQAKALLSTWDISVVDVADANEKAPETFEEARQKGRDLVVELESMVNEASDVRKRLRVATDANRGTLESQGVELASQVQQMATRTLAMLELAIDLADETTPRRDINDVRFLQSFCYFAFQRYYESALIGEFLLSKYPTIDGTRPAMPIMIQSYSVLLDQAKDGDHEFERNQLSQACIAVVDRWPGSLEAGLAASTMTRLMLADLDFEAAEKYFLKIPESASLRGPLGLRLGRRLWGEYRRQRRKPNVDPAAVADLLQRSKQYLKLGVDAVTLDSLTYDTATGALLLVDAHLENGEFDEAIKQLEGTIVAPLDLVKQKHPAVTQTPKAAAFSRETYKTAIKVYLVAMKNSSDRQQWIDKTNGVLTAMRQAMETSQDPQDRARITAIYQLIAVELKSSFESISDPAEKQKFALTLASFLGSIEKDSSDAKTVLWAGATLLYVADSLSQSGLTADAKSLSQQAVSALNRAESIGFKGDAKESMMKTELKRQRALAHRGSGDFKSANAQFLEILRVSPNALKTQIDAAENLQMWAKATKRPNGYVEAIKGASLEAIPKTKGKKKLIWGWEKIMYATRRKPQYQDSYFLALARIIECRLEYGVLRKDQKAIVSAGNEIANERKRNPEFSGSQKWKSKFDALEKRVDAARK